MKRPPVVVLVWLQPPNPPPLRSLLWLKWSCVFLSVSEWVVLADSALLSLTKANQCACVRRPQPRPGSALHLASQGPLINRGHRAAEKWTKAGQARPPPQCSTSAPPQRLRLTRSSLQSAHAHTCLHPARGHGLIHGFCMHDCVFFKAPLKETTLQTKEKTFLMSPFINVAR